jgi:S1-C subfamily serine protease
VLHSAIAAAALLVGAVLTGAARSAEWPNSFGPTAARPTAQAPPERPHPAVVRVIAPEGGGTSYGSGTLVDVRGDYGLVLTNWHVVADATGTLEVLFPDGFRSAARLITTDRTWDLAALAVWRPNAAPVPLATRAPQPGEPLTIAGYGSGTYRAITGTCTQYVAPALNKPYEMVELSVAARQGDSGGPILNSQGELAGVLWGAGWGTTSGSYSGRVAAFVAAIMPPPGVGEESQLVQGSRAQQPATEAAVPVQYSAPLAQSSIGRGNIADHQTTAARATIVRPGAPGREQGAAAGSASSAKAGFPAGEPASAIEQIELFLAFVGGAAILLHSLRLLLPAR